MAWQFLDEEKAVRRRRFAVPSQRMRQQVRVLRFETLRRRMIWLLPMVFVWGYIGTFSTFDEFALTYFVLTLASLFMCCLLLSALNRPLEVTAPVWVLLLLFLGGYYFQFYWIAYVPDIASTAWFGHLGWIAGSAATLVDAYATTTYAFVTFCLTAWLLIRGEMRTDGYHPRRNIGRRSLTVLLLWLIPFLMSVTSYLMYITGIAVMGAEGVELPFRIAGVIFYTRFTVIPALLLLLIWWSDSMNLPIASRIGIILLCVHGLSDMVLRGSKGAFVFLAISLMFLFLLTGRMNRKRTAFIIISVLFTVLLWPLISAYRIFRIPMDGMLYAFGEAIDTIRQGPEPPWELLGDTLKQLIFRITGMGSLLPIVGVDIHPLGISKLFDPIVERVFTVEVYGFSPHAIQGTAPGLLGWFRLVGGDMFVVIGVCCFVILTQYLWNLAPRLRLYCLPVGQSMLLLWILGFAMEGAMDRLSLGFLTTVIAITVCELLLRNCTRSYSVVMPSWETERRRAL